MTNRDASSHASTPHVDDANVVTSGKVTSAEERALQMASLRLRNALDRANDETDNGEIAAARLHLRDLAVKMRDAGFWRNDKAGLRATVSLLWQADRYVNDQALQGGDRAGL